MRLLVDEAFAQVSRVELLEDVFVVEILEHSYRTVELVIDLSLAYTFLRLLKQGIAISSQLERRKIKKSRSINFKLE